jgi:hypothetical protein
MGSDGSAVRRRELADTYDGLLEPFRRLGTDRPAGDRGLGLGR